MPNLASWLSDRQEITSIRSTELEESDDTRLATVLLIFFFTCLIRMIYWHLIFVSFSLALWIRSGVGLFEIAVEPVNILFCLFLVFSVFPSPSFSSPILTAHI